MKCMKENNFYIKKLEIIFVIFLLSLLSVSAAYAYSCLCPPNPSTQTDCPCTPNNNCTKVFPDGVQTTSSSGSIVFDNTGSPSVQEMNYCTKLVAKTVTDPTLGECKKNASSWGACTASTSPTSVPTLNAGTFQASSDVNGAVTVNYSAAGTSINPGNYTTITLTAGSSSSKLTTLTFNPAGSGTTTYYIDALNLRTNTQVFFAPGDYWIGRINFLSSSGTTARNFDVSSAGTARIFVQNVDSSTSSTTPNIIPNNVMSAKTQWNTDFPSNPEYFLLYSYANLTFSSPGTSTTSTFNGFMYSQGTLTTNNAVSMSGGFTAANMSINRNTTITANSDNVCNVNWGFLCPSINNFAISTSSSGTYCLAQNVSVTAQDSGGATVTGYTGTITLNAASTGCVSGTSCGTWTLVSGGGSFSGGTQTGTATYTYVAGDMGVATFAFNYSNVVDNTVVLTASAGSVGSNSPTITYANAQILVTNGIPPLDTTPYNQTITAGDTVTMNLAGYSGVCGLNALYSGIKSLKFWTTYVDPSTGTVQAKVNGNTVATSQGAATAQNVLFAAGLATVTFQYSDVGSLILNVQDASATNITGATGTFVNKPAQFVISVPSLPTAQSPLSNTAAFVKAGTSFTVNVAVKDSLGNLTPNYGNESTKEKITVAANTLVEPTSAQGGVLGTISYPSDFVSTGGGNFQNTGVTYSDAGFLTLIGSVKSGNYLGVGGNVSGPASGNVGRFIPDHLRVDSVTAPVLLTQCSSGGFTYLDQPFGYSTAPVLKVSAENKSNTTLNNYRGSYWKLNNANITQAFSFGAYGVSSGTAITPVPTFSTSGASIGTATDNGNTKNYPFTTTGFVFVRPTTSPIVLIPAFNAEVQWTVTATDTDNVTGNLVSGGTTSGAGISFSSGKSFYYGAMAISNAIGPENINMAVPVTTQYYDAAAGGFRTLTLDNCTTMSATNFGVISNPNSLSTSILSIGAASMVNGGNTVTLKAPGAGNTGYVDIQAFLKTGESNTANLPWLLYDWPYNGSTGNPADDPIGRVTFGVYQGNPKQIYQYEKH